MRFGWRPVIVMAGLAIAWGAADVAAAPAADGPPSDDNVTRVDAAPRPAGDAALVEALGELLEKQRFGATVVRCEQRKRAAEEMPPRVREACGRGYLGLGDKLLGIGATDAAMKRWTQATEVDPRLLDDPHVWVRLQTGALPAGVEPPTRVVGERPERPSEHVPPRQPVERTPPVTVAAEVAAEPAEPPEPAGPRGGRTFGVGLSFGYDGVAAVTLSLLASEAISAEVSVGVLFPMVDLRIRWHGMREALTPVIGLGMTTPLADNDIAGLDLTGYEALYELGESIHVDIGLSWAVGEHLDLFGGVAFVTPLDQDHADTVVFFPQAAAQVLWYF